MMRLQMRRWLSALAVLLLAASWAMADSKPYVVLVGIDNYADKAIKPRAHAENDARLLYDTLVDKKYLGAAPDQIKLLLGSKDARRPSDVATRENILKAITWALTNAREDDLVIIAWFGQAAPVGDRACYFAQDSTLKNRAKDAIGAAELEELFSKEKSTRVCVLMDVHFRGYDAGDEKIPEHSLDRRFTEFDGVKEGSDEPAKPIMVLAASGGLDPSVETERNGLFAEVVVEGLRGAADSEGGEADGLVTVDELVEFVRKEVALRAVKLGKKEQRTLVFGRSTRFVLTANPAVGERVAEQLARFEKLAKDAGLKPELVKEGFNFLARMPRQEAERKLRKKYADLVAGAITLEQFEKDRASILETLKLSREAAELFADRVIEVAQIAERYYIKPVNINELAAEAIKGLYRRLDEKLPKQIAERVDDIKNLDKAGVKALLADARQELGNRDDLKGSKATDYALDMMLHSLDNYSTYIDPETKFKFDQSTKQEFIGVGVQIQKDLTTDMVRVSTPLKDSPAYKAGMKTGDLITAITNVVDKKTGEPLPTPVVTSTKGLTIEQVVDKILGPEGTLVRLTVEREEADGVKEHVFEIKRGKVQVETVFGVRRNADDSWDYYLDKNNKIVYIRLDQFALNTERDLRAALAEAQKTGINALILDLRFNPGGYLQSAQNVSDLFIDDGLIVTIRPRAGRANELRGVHDGSLLGFPMVVLINGQSASASEIVSACLQDHERAIIMGERSFGKGSVQNIIDLRTPEGLAEVKLTTATFWRPSGKNLNKAKGNTDADEWGVMPHKDFIIKLTPSERSELFEHLRRSQVIPRRDAPKKEEPVHFTDKQLEKALQYLKERVTSKASRE